MQGYDYVCDVCDTDTYPLLGVTHGDPILESFAIVVPSYYSIYKFYVKIRICSKCMEDTPSHDHCIGIYIKKQQPISI